MENASKALIIAGAILLAILLITAGIVVIRAIDPVSQQAKDSAETMAIESYNAQFIKYEGEKMSGAQVKALISTVRSSNAVHENEVKITYVDSETGETISEDLLSSETKIIPNAKYDVTITEWSDGYIKAMTVSGVKGLTIAQPVVPGDETPVNNSPTVTAIVENITTTTAKIVATGTDADEGDTLTYNFYILNTEKNKEGTTDETWKVTGLDSNTKYDYKVEVTDGKITKGTTGTFTTLEETPINNAPTINPTVTNIETNSVTINADGKDIDGDTLTYVLYIAGNKYGESQTGKWDITGLSSNTRYEYKVTVTDGKISEPVEKIGQFTTKKENTPPTITATVSNVREETATITANGSDVDGDRLEYTFLINGIEKQKGASSTYDAKGLIENKSYSYEVRVTDQKSTANAKGSFTTDVVTIEIAKATDITSNSAVLKVKAKSDKGYDLKYKIEIWDYSTAYNIHSFTSNRISSGSELENKVEGLNSNNSYICEVRIYYGDTNTEVADTRADFYTIKANSAPIITANALKSEYNQRFIISAKATDEDGDNLTYKLYTSTNRNSGYTLKATLSAKTQGQAVDLDSKEYISDSTKYWYIEVSDGTETVKNNVQSVYWCNGPTIEECSCGYEVYPTVSYHEVESYPCFCDALVGPYTYGICDWCGGKISQTEVSCGKCGMVSEAYSVDCGCESYWEYDDNCSNCLGDGTINYLCDHRGYYRAHAVIGN